MCYHHVGMMRVVLDTNVFVSALLNADGSSRAVLRLALSGRLKAVFANALFAEYESLLARTQLWRACPLDAAQRSELFEALLSVSDWVRISYLWRPNMRDEADNHALELAVAGGASAIITANLRDFRSAELLFPAIRIITPAGFLQWRQRP